MTRSLHERGGVRDAAGRLAWATGLTFLASKTLARNPRFALMFHGVSSRRLPNVDHLAQPHITADELASTLKWLRRRFAFLTPEQFLAGSAPGVLLTFDDGFANNFTNALPLLRSFECPAVFFVSTQHVANPRDWLGFVRFQAQQVWGSLERVPKEVARDWYDGLGADQLRELAADPFATVGSHGVTHSVLTECPDADLALELRESRAYLEDLTGAAVDYFAYPRGQYDARVARQTEGAGYRAAFAIDSIGLGAQNYELPRVGIYQPERWYLELKLSGLHRRPLPVVADCADER